jgi:hypothetical protein
MAALDYFHAQKAVANPAGIRAIDDEIPRSQ